MIPVKIWTKYFPTPEEVRPGRCPRCGKAGYEPGRKLGMHGHGVIRGRQLLGPPDAEGRAEQQSVDVRSYVCTGCGRTVIVVPKEFAFRRHYNSGAIGLALFLYGVLELSARQVRERIRPFRTVGYSAPDKWRTLIRWIEAASEGRLFASIRASPGAFSPRQRAARVAMSLLAQADPISAEATAEQRVFAGAVHAALRPFGR